MQHEQFHVGQRVKRSDITDASIPAFKAARATVVAVQSLKTAAGTMTACARVHWDGDSTPDTGFRDGTTITDAGES